MGESGKVKIGCAWQGGWRSNYWKSFGFCEVSTSGDTTPRNKTLERWRSEAPDTAEFVVWVDDTVPASGFKGEAAAEAWAASLTRASLLGSKTLALRTPARFRPNQENIDAMTAFLVDRIPSGTKVAWWAEGLWEGQAELQGELCDALGLTPVADPMTIDDPSELPGGDDFYWRIMGRRGLRGGFSDYELFQLVQLAQARQGGHIFFTSNDMLRDARQLGMLLESS